MEAFLALLPSEEESKISMGREGQAALCISIYKRLIAVKNYDSSDLPPLRTPIVLLKPTAPTLRTGDEDYGLSKVFTVFNNYKKQI